MRHDLSAYDFVDFGCSGGGSIAFGKGHLGGRRGLGLDVNPKKVDAARAAGFDAEVADVTKLDPERTGTVRFVLMSHFLEHLPGRAAAEACLRSASRIAEEFVLVRQPYFDADGYLFSLGLKLYWSDWTGHPYHMTSLDFHDVLNPILKTSEISRFLIFFRSRIEDSRHDAVHPISSPRDQHEWKPEIHGSKPAHQFVHPVFREAGAVVLTKSKAMNDDVMKFLRSCEVTFDSDNAAAPLDAS